MQMMIDAFKTFRNQSPALIFTPTPSGLKASGIRFKQATTLHSSESDRKPNMDSKPETNPTVKTRDAMAHSFGEGYATRSDEEGFGVVFSGNQSLPKTEQDQLIHGNHPAYDKTQGSEVKEKEKG